MKKYAIVERQVIVDYPEPHLEARYTAYEYNWWIKIFGFHIHGYISDTYQHTAKKTEEALRLKLGENKLKVVKFLEI